MPAPDRDAVLTALRAIADPASGQDLVTAGLVQGLVIRGGQVGFALEVDGPDDPRGAALEKACTDAVKALPGVETVRVILTAHRGGPPKDGKARPSAAQRRQGPPKRTAHQGHAGTSLKGIAEVGAIIAVASGKGGVGKSTLAVNLATALAKLGQRTGLLDADIYGPSIPRMLGLTDSPEKKGEFLQPLEAHGVTAMSIGLLIGEETPMIWRGPMVTRALMQLFGDVAWGPLDILVVDLPPGTGDTQLTLVQRVPLAGGVIVSTPQEVALIDARKGLEMFRKTEVPILGLVENMAYFQMPGTEEKNYIFGEGGARRTAEEKGTPFLGELPLYPEIRAAGDAGAPVVTAAPDSPAAQAFMTIATRTLEELDRSRGTVKPPPEIIFE